MSKWINVKKRMPVPEHTCLVYGRGEDVSETDKRYKYMAYFHKYSESWYTVETEGKVFDVTHWQYLPHKPREECCKL